MNFTSPLIEAVCIQRYKRFFVDIRLKTGDVITAHCPNTGTMKTCLEPGWRVMLSRSASPTRKLAYTLEMVHNGRTWIGVNTLYANRVARDAIVNGRIPELQGFFWVKSEVRYGTNSRVDLLLSNGVRDAYVEVKSVTYLGEDGAYQFPDAVSLRGQ